MRLHRRRAALRKSTALLIATSPSAAAALDNADHSVDSTWRQAMLDRAACHVEAAHADLASVIHQDQSAESLGEIAALAAVVTVLRISGKSLSPGEAAFIVKRTPATLIAWCRKFGIGAKAGGRWLVDPTRLALHLLGAAS